MAYRYQTERAALFSEDGQARFLAVRDNVQRLLKQAGAVRMAEAWNGCSIGDSWFGLACLDRMVELGEIREVTLNGSVAGQHRVFVSARHA